MFFYFLPVFELEALLLGDRTMVRLAANTKNERRLAICLSSELEAQNKELANKYAEKEGCQLQFVEGGMKPFSGPGCVIC